MGRSLLRSKSAIPCLPQGFVDSIDAPNLIQQCFGTKSKGDNTMDIILKQEAPLALVRIIDQLDKDFKH